MNKIDYLQDIVSLDLLNNKTYVFKFKNYYKPQPFELIEIKKLIPPT